MIPADQWERMKAEAYDRCMAEHSDAGMALMNEATGIKWSEPGIPDKLPPTPGVREGLMETIDHFPRRLSRKARRMFDSWDRGGAMEVIAILYDAEFEARITGEDRRAIYLEYLYEIPYAMPVLDFVFALHKWLTGNDDFDWIRQVERWLYALGLVDDSPERLMASRPMDPDQRPPPLKMRPCITADGPPAAFGRYSGLALRAAA